MIEEIEHTADAGIRVTSDDLLTLFEECMWGMLALIMEGRAENAENPIEINVSAYETDNLLIKFLSEVLYIVQDEYYYPGKLVIKKLKHNKLSAILYTSSDVKLFGEIKNVTYHNFELKQIGEKWQCSIIFDI